MSGKIIILSNVNSSSARSRFWYLSPTVAIAHRSECRKIKFEQIIITYAVQKPYKFIGREPYKNVSVYNEPTVNKPEIIEQPVMKAEKSDSNPILNVIKKPYSWIKALGSKLK